MDRAGAAAGREPGAPVRRRLGQARDLAGPRARRERRVAAARNSRRQPAAVRASERYPDDARAGRVGLDPARPARARAAHAGRLACRAQRREHESRVDRVVLRRLQRQSQVGASAGSRSRAWLGRRRLVARPSESRKAIWRRAREPRHRRALPAAFPSRRIRARRPRPPAARRRTPATCPAERRPSSSRRRPASPNSASATGASMPAATREVPAPVAPRSSSIDAHAALARAPGDRQADHAPADHEQIR